MNKRVKSIDFTHFKTYSSTFTHPDFINQQKTIFAYSDLIEQWQSDDFKTNRNSFTIAEVGFGCASNFLLSWNLWESYSNNKQKLHFISYAPKPFDMSELQEIIAFWPELTKQAKAFLKSFCLVTEGFHHRSYANDRVLFTLIIGDVNQSFNQLLQCGDPTLEASLCNQPIDLWFINNNVPICDSSYDLDGLVHVVNMLSKSEAQIISNLCSDSLINSLSHHGFQLNKKTHTAFHASLIKKNGGDFKHKNTPWHAQSRRDYSKKTAIVLGAGLSGCFCAYFLAKKGWDVTVLDRSDRVAQGASANRQAILFPKLSIQDTILNRFLLSAFLHAHPLYTHFLEQGVEGALQGVLIVADSLREQKAQAQLKDWLKYLPELGRLVTACDASRIAGVPIRYPALHILMSGWINSVALCDYLIQSEKIEFIPNTEVTAIEYDGLWHADQYRSEVMILANGYQLNALDQTHYIPIIPVKGQMSQIAATGSSKELLIPICGQGHVSAVYHGMHHCGASYELHEVSIEETDANDRYNISRLKALVPDIYWSDSVLNHWTGIRAATSDYFPVVGAIAQSTKFLKRFATLKKDAKKWIPHIGAFYPGLYGCAGFGSRGITSIPFCAEWLAALINNEFNFLPRSYQQALSPARFLRNALVYNKSV